MKAPRFAAARALGISAGEIRLTTAFRPVVKMLALCSIWIGFVLSAFAASARDRSEMEAATRLQIFLDRANFGPGKIDGKYGEFTTKALQLYRIAQGSQTTDAPSSIPPIVESSDEATETSSKSKSVKESPPNVSDLNLTSIDPVFTTYSITEDDTKLVGEVPSEPAAQAKLKWLPYRNVAEAIAERFHCDVDFLEELNAGKMKDLRPGDTVTVPNVEPFYFKREGGEKSSKAANKDGESKSGAQSNERANELLSERKLSVSTETNMVEVHEGDKLVAAFPVTVGSTETNSPIGEWKVERITPRPFFRYDKQMLKHGERSGNFHLLPPGPNNPVGIMWIGLNKKGIGLHGTDSPDQIGRSASHGCIRLANWDVVKLAALIKPGVAVTIQ